MNRDIQALVEVLRDQRDRAAQQTEEALAAARLWKERADFYSRLSWVEAALLGAVITALVLWR